MANRNWRSSGYNSYNQLLQPVSYFAQPIGYSNERKSFGGKPNYDDKRNRKDFQVGRRDRSPIRRRASPYQRSHDSHGSYRKDNRKPHTGRHEYKARLTFDVKELSTYSLKHRYSRMYIPSDFFHTNLNWQEAFPLYRPMRLGNNCEFQIINKEVEIEGLVSNDLFKEPEDVDTKYSAKVMLLSTPSLTNLIKSTTKINDPKSQSNRNELNSSIQFLMGNKGKNEPMAIGGAWSPSLDGADPEVDPNVLINTAIRTCQALTGIDLSKCKKWTKFMEINYFRPGDRQEDTDKKDEEIKEDKIETVVIFIPDIWSCVPNEKEWSELKEKFSTKLAELVPLEEEKIDDVKEINEIDPDVSMKSEDASEKCEVKDVEAPKTSTNLANLKVVELKALLNEKGLDNKGVKTTLIQRLTEAMEKEKMEEAKAEPKEKVETEKTSEETAEDKTEDKVEAVVPVETVVPVEVVAPVETVVPVDIVVPVEVKKVLTEKEKANYKKNYTLPDLPSIIVRPNNNAKDARFDCGPVSLDSLLEYRVDDQKEHVFEVSLFAEQFSEMLQRDALFYIYRSLINLPEVDTSETDEPEAKKAKLEVSKNRKVKMVPDMHLLFNFSVCDSDNSGYIRDHVLEYCIHNLGLNLSRSQVKKLINKIPNRKGSLMYKDIAIREVVEGSVEDISTLKMQIENVQKLAELAQGNKAFFEDGEMESVSRTGELELLDKLEETEYKKMNCELQLSMLVEEIDKLKNVENDSGSVVTDLRDSIGKTDEKLEIEKTQLEKLAETNVIYYNLLKNARDAMDVSVKSISDQYEVEKLAKEAEKQKAEEEKTVESA